MEVSREYLMDEFPYYMGILKGRGYALPEDMAEWELYDVFDSLEEDEKKDYIGFLYDGEALTEEFIRQIYDYSEEKDIVKYAIKLYESAFSKEFVEDLIDFGIDKESLLKVMNSYDGTINFARIVDVANILEDEDITKKLLEKCEDEALAYEIEDLLSIFDDTIYDNLAPFISKLSADDQKYIIEQWG